MSELRVTEWFDGATTVPGQPGIFERRWTNGNEMPYPFYEWDGLAWIGLGGRTAGRCVGRNISCFQNLPWRGLTEPCEMQP